MTGLELYLPAAELSGVDGSNVTVWSDASGHSPNRDANTSVGPHYPTLAVGASPKGANLVRFGQNAADNAKNIGGTIAENIPFTNGFSFYVWYQLSALTGSTGQSQRLLNWLFNFEPDTAAAEGLGLPNDHIGLYNGGFVQNGNVSSGVEDLGPASTARHYLSFVCQPPPTGGATASGWLDGVHVDDWTWIRTPTSWGSYIVGNNGAPNVGIIGSIGAVLIYSVAHDTQTRQAVEKFLAHTYG